MTGSGIKAAYFLNVNKLATDPVAAPKNLITRAVGAQVEIEVEIHVHPLEDGDIYLLCSDGLTDMLSYDQIHRILKQQNAHLEICCQSLVNGANNCGGRDNISVILLKVSQLHQRKLMDIFAS